MGSVGNPRIQLITIRTDAEFDSKNLMLPIPKTKSSF